jgi:hypothetical protein
MDPGPDARDAATSKKQPYGEMYRLQTQAFIEAGEEVDMDEDVLEDLLSGFGDDDIPDMTVSHEELELEEKTQPDDLDFSEFNQYAEEGGLSKYTSRSCNYTHLQLRIRGQGTKSGTWSIS